MKQQQQWKRSLRKTRDGVGRRRRRERTQFFKAPEIKPRPKRKKKNDSFMRCFNSGCHHFLKAELLFFFLHNHKDKKKKTRRKAAVTLNRWLELWQKMAKKKKKRPTFLRSISSLSEPLKIFRHQKGSASGNCWCLFFVVVVGFFSVLFCVCVMY